MKAFLKRNILYILLILLLSISTLFLLQESLGRGIFILSSLVFWFVFLILTKKGITASLLYILLVLPFNITYQLHYSTNLFDPFVNGIFVNYLNPTVSILDLGVLLLLFSILKEVKISFLRKTISKFKWYLISFLVFLLLQNILLFDLLIFVNSLRFITFVLLLVFLPPVLPLLKSKAIQLPFTLILIFNTFFQGILGIIQFTRGASLGWEFLGESQVVNGMQGSSFLELYDGIYLRAYGTFPHPNILAGFFLLVFFLSIFVFFKERRVFRYIYLAMAFLSGIFVIFTFSRIVLILFVLNALAIFLIYVFKVKGKQFFAFTPTLLIERFGNLFGEGDTSLGDRVNLFKASLSVLKENWLAGTGSGNFVKAMEDFVPRTGSGIQLLQPVHNVLMLLLTDFGVFGFFAFLFLVGKIFFVYIKKITWFTLLLLFSVGLIGMLDHYLISLPQGIVMLCIFLVLSFLFSDTLKKDENNVYKN